MNSMSNQMNFTPSQNQPRNRREAKAIPSRPAMPPVASTSSIPAHGSHSQHEELYEFVAPNLDGVTTRDPIVPPSYPNETIFGYNKHVYLEDCYHAVPFPNPQQIVHIAKEAQLKEAVVEKWMEERRVTAGFPRSNPESFTWISESALRSYRGFQLEGMSESRWKIIRRLKREMERSESSSPQEMFQSVVLPSALEEQFQGVWPPNSSTPLYFSLLEGYDEARAEDGRKPGVRRAD